MKSKTINSILTKKLAAFAESITDPAVKAIVEQNTIFTGGCIVSLLTNVNVNDYDLYFRTKEAALAVGSYYCKKYKELHPDSGYDLRAELKDDRVSILAYGKNHSVAGEAPESEVEPGADAEGIVESADEVPASALEESEKDAGPKYRPLFLSSNAITLSNKVQLVVRFSGEPDQIHENYDFVHCTSYWTSWDKKLVLRAEALEAILTKELRYVGSKYPICSIIRTRKFLARGWTINAGQYIKMCWQVAALDLENLEVLKDQLVGVDSAYFFALLSQLKAKQKEVSDSGQAFNLGDYLITLIDKIF